MDFANKYTIEGIPGVNPLEYFEKINKTLKDFFTHHRNIKLRLILICKMKKINFEQKKIDEIKVEKDEAYFTSGNLINMKSTDVDKLRATVRKYRPSSGKG